MPLLVSPHRLATSTLVAYFRKSTASCGASLPTANPLPPPKASVGSPAPPSTAGNGNQPRSSPIPLLSGELAFIVPGAHCPISIIAAPPVAIVAACPPAPSHTAARYPFWNGSSSVSRRSSVPALTNGSASHAPASAACCIASAPPRRSARYAHQNIAGHLSPAPRESGVIPASFSVWTSSRNSSHVVGGAVIPACSNCALLYQNPTMPRSKGMPYCLPSTWYMPTAASLRSPIHGWTSAVMSLTRPASTCSRSPPPPHDWNRSGGSPAWRRGAIAVLNASFS